MKLAVRCFVMLWLISFGGTGMSQAWAQERARDLGLWMAPKEVSRLEGSATKFTVVDVRPDKDFAASRIPGSLNVPLHFVKTKTFLRDHLVILAGTGGEWLQLEQEALNLQAAGFSQVFILDGGLPGWRRDGLPVEGPEPPTGNVSAGNLWQLRDYADALIVLVYDDRAVATEPPDGLDRALRLDSLSLGDLRSRLPSSGVESDTALWPTVVVVTTSGRPLAQAQLNLLPRRAHILLFGGGLAAWEAFIAGQTAAGRTVKIAGTGSDALRSSQKSGCATCP